MDGYAKIYNPAENASQTLTWRGEEFEADEDGAFEVPNEAFEELKSHGYVPFLASAGRGHENRS